VQHVQAGLWWPAADPGKLRAAAAAWRSVAADLEAVSASASAVARSVTAENQGQAVDAFEAYWVGRWTGGSGALRAVADGAQALAAALDRYAAAVEKARARIQELIAAAVTVAIIGVGLTVLTVGVSDVAAGAVAGTLVATAAAVGMELSAEVAAIIATALVITSMGALQGGLSDLAIQTERIACFHDQPSIDWNEIGQWAAFGALAGTAGAGASTGLRAAAQIGAPTVGRIGERLGVEELPAWTSTRLGRRIGSMAAGAAGGAGTAALTDEVTTGQIDAADVLTGAFAGAGGGWVAGQPVYKRLTWVQQCDMLMAASRGKGQFGVGSATAADADILGHAWVGEGYTIASDGTTIVSADGLRQYRPPAYKPRQGRYQANLEWKLHGLRAWQSNAHIEIIDLP
jgi:hypothetical protein